VAVGEIVKQMPQRGKYASMAKVFCSDTAMAVTVEAIQVLGGYG
jgi:alkylation response protein AidB-like acyl-CoA dehydrogenase